MLVRAPAHGMANQVQLKLVVPVQSGGYVLFLSRAKERQLELSVAHIIKSALLDLLSTILPIAVPACSSWSLWSLP